MSLKGRNITIGLTGGIACYKVPYLVRQLIGQQAAVRILMTEAACRFITPLTMETVSRNPIAVKMFPDEEFVSTRHIEMADWPDLIVIAPATANFLGKVASGISDDLLTTVVCASPKPVLIAPAMNTRMWENRITQKNFEYLKESGYHFVGPESGEMAEKGHVGPGRMSEPEQICREIERLLGSSPKKKVLAGKKILVTAGPTREALDPVRYLSNHSSGKMGYALAAAAQALGADTVLISGPTSLAAPANVKLIAVESTDQMARAVRKEFKSADCLLMAAAPSDYRAASMAKNKIKREDSGLELTLKPTPDILRSLDKSRKPGQVIVGFALETENGLANARKKLKSKNLDLIVLNSPGEGTGFGTETNQVTIIRPRRKPDVWELQKKSDIARLLLENIATML